jgi:hypothetical protein
MDNLMKEIRQVQRRLAFQRFLGILGWCWLVSLAAAAAVGVTARFRPLEIVDWHWPAGCLAVGLIVAVGWVFATGIPSLQAALEIDRRCGLKERVSSAVALKPAERESEVGQALIADADNRLRRAAVLEHFPVRPPRLLLLPLLPALLIGVVMFWPQAKPKEAIAAVDPPRSPPPVEMKKTADELRQKLAERRKQAEKEGLKDATELLKRLEEGTGELQSQTQREKVLVKLNDLTRELQERRKQLGGSSESLKRQMEQIQGIDRGPADKLAKSLAKGDFQKAAQELEKLQKQLAGSNLDPAKKQELAKQFEQLKQKLDQLAQQAKDAQADLQNRADQMKQAGNNEAARKLEDQIQKLQQQGPQLESLQGLASKLGQCSKQMQQGDSQQAAQSMQEIMQQVETLARQQNELKTLDGAMQQIADARRQINCDKCGGKGCKDCQGQAEAGALADKGEGAGDGDKKDGPPGMGLGQGLGDGARPEAKVDGKFFDSRVPGNVGKGAGQVTGVTNGPNLKNQAEIEIQKATSEIERGSTDPLSGQHLPKKQAEHAKQYFDSFREGK